tara:strand:- start:55 stop:597 length:543 start_codon:yes stop_codon:yes gene_type:complete
MQATTDPATSKKLVAKKPAPNIALAAAALGLYKNDYPNAQRAMGEMNKAYPNAIASHNGVKLVKEWKDKIFRYHVLNPPGKEDTTGMKRTFSVEKIVESAGAAVQSLRESFREEPAEDEAEKAPETTPDVKQELDKDYPLARKATPTKVLPTIANEAEADKRVEPKKPALPACLRVCNIQ